MSVERQDIYTIGTVARLAGVSVPTIRLYEREGLLIPKRTSSNRRMFDERDVKRIECIRQMVHDNHLTFAGIRRLFALVPCWELKGCCADDKRLCSAYRSTELPCWAIENTICRQKGIDCRTCEVYNAVSSCEFIKDFLKKIGEYDSQEIIEVIKEQRGKANRTKKS